MKFPKDFVWGAAAASYQVEGAAFEDGKGRSIWDEFTHTPDRIIDNTTGDVACDHYHRYKEDVALMKQIGLQAYRLSISWPRVMPAGVGAVNEKGLAFYDRLIDELLAAGIVPYVTLYHWDMPYELYLRGGWLNRRMAEWFADYTAVVIDRLSNRVRNWMTLNEPQVIVMHGMFHGDHAPGLKLPFGQTLTAAHNLLLAHGRSCQVIRSRSKVPCRIGWAPVASCHIPATNSPADIEAARQQTFALRKDARFTHSWWNDPIFFGHYPDGAEAFHGSNMPDIQPGDMETISQKLDFLGLNCYNGQPTQAGPQGPQDAPWPDGAPVTAFKWPVTPEILYWAPKFFYERYKTPVIITENGMSNVDWVSLDGHVHDPQRIDYTQRHLREFARTMSDGVEGLGYLHWSIMDNFEWAQGYKQRFGMIYVDYPTQKRTLKDSALWYKTVIETNGRNI